MEKFEKITWRYLPEVPTSAQDVLVCRGPKHNWRYPPEEPDINIAVLIAVEGEDEAVKGYYHPDINRWCATESVDGEKVYAWQELPELPPLPEIEGNNP